MVGRRLLGLIIAVLLVAVGPASAGTATNPEIVDACGAAAPNGREPVHSWEDICSAWFATADADGGVVVTLKTGALQPRTPTMHSVAWQTGDCRLQVVSEDASGPVDAGERTLSINCGETAAACDPDLSAVGGGRCTTYAQSARVPLDGAVSETADTIRFTVRRNAVPAAHRDLFAPDAQITKSVAFSGPVVAGTAVVVWGTCAEFTCDSKIGDWTPGGRTFVIGS